MPSSPIRKLIEFAVAAEKRGTKVYYLNIGQPDVHSPEAFWKAVSNTGIKVLEYSHSAGIAPLRDAMVEDYKKIGIELQPKDILVTTGGSEAMLFSFMTLFNPGDEVVVIEPFYANYAAIAAMAGVKLIAVTTRIEEDFAPPSTAEIASKLTPRTKAIILTNPNNPTGGAYSAQQVHELAKIAIEKDLFLIGDEVYRDFYYGDEELVSLLSIPGLEKHAVLIDSASKKFSVCGARVGYLISRNADVMAGALKFGQARLASPTLDQIGVLACLKEVPPSYFEDVRKEYIARRDTMVNALKKMPGVIVPSIQGAFYAVVQLPVDDADEFCKWLLTDFAWEGQTVLMAPAKGFYITPGLGVNQVRIAYVLEQEKIEAAMTCLAEALKVYPGRTA